MALGYGSDVSASNQVRIGDGSITSIGGYVNWTNVSDSRVKKNIKENVPGLEFINKLTPVTYNLNLEAADEILGTKSSDRTRSAEETSGREAKEKVIYSGFLAQDVEKAAKDLDYDFSGVDAAKNDNDLYGLRYSDFVVPLVKAVQELSSQNQKLQEEIDELKAEKNTSGETKISTTSVELSDARLEQNFPNPFNSVTTIRCYLPSTSHNATVTISSVNGKEMQSFPLSNSGMNEIKIDAGTLSAGDYIYSLSIDGKMIDSKRMTITR